MKFVTAYAGSDVFVGVVHEQKVVHLSKADETIPNTMIECVELGELFIEKVQRVLERVQPEWTYELHDVQLLAPIPRPIKNIFCIGKNYADHAQEMGSIADRENMIVFSKAPTTVIGHEAPILRHADVTDQLDYEGELAIVIGKKGKAIPKEQALDYVFGYTIVNDVTARDLQERHKQYLLGKSLDTSCPMGPWIVHRSAIAHPHALHIETKVNGEVRQSATTAQFIFDIPTIIATMSKGMTLEPGDVIATGTPAGVGKGMNPPRFLQSGDVIEITIDQIGTLRNVVK
ncbi:MAG: fumarylacetoacetate hydrolase family protein [Anoxybacillus ayderensis]|nr:fumarylacetoacetate hydrolase family protein [Anoxybacillus ayderensis]